MTAARPLVDALDAAIAAQQDVIAQLVRARADAASLYGEAEPERDPVPYVDYLPSDLQASR